jgi:lysophospholipid acyltransferase (LPLAT)-like uncharacterized protein
MFPARHPDALAGGPGRREGTAPFRASPQAPGGVVARLGAAVLGRYFEAIAGRGPVTYVDGHGSRMDADAAGSLITDLITAPTPLIVTYWIADALAVAMLPFVNEAFRELLHVVTCVVDDTFAGRVAGRFIDNIGGRAMLVALPGEPERLRQVHSLIRSRTSCGFPVDGGGPYGEVGTGIIALATALRAPIVPIAAVARPALLPVHRSRVRLPMPNAALIVGIGESLHVDVHQDRRVEASRLRETIDQLRGMVRDVVSPARGA